MEILLGILVIIGSGLLIAQVPKPKMIPIRVKQPRSRNSRSGRM
ncbi:MAG: hypothetical protein WCI18_11340 [Pseudomonadota bacterium]